MPKAINSLSNNLVGVAGVHLVVFKLAMRGLIAIPTVRNTAGIDILVTEPTSNASASLQVKTSQKKVRFWPTSKPQKCLRGANCFYVFIRFLPKENRFQIFLEESNRVVKRVEEIVRNQKKRNRSVFPCWDLPKDIKAQKKLEDKWINWRPSHQRVN
jgi:hypothetical protein